MLCQAIRRSSELFSMDYMDEVQEKLLALLNDLPTSELTSEMKECEAVVRDYLGFSTRGGPAWRRTARI